MLNYRERLPLFPITTRVVGAGDHARLQIAGCDLQALAAQYDTPLYLYDQATLDQAAAAYRTALSRHYPAASGVTYAGKAFLCVAAAQWAARQGFIVDCTGAGELAIAAAAGIERKQILVHGVNKRADDLAAAHVQASVIVVDNLTELERLAALFASESTADCTLWLRVKPGVAVATHAYRQTGQEESKFGLSPAEVAAAATYCRQRNLPLTGLHFHQGSHFHDPKPIGPALDGVLDLMLQLQNEIGWLPAVLCPGGGWGVAYHESELPHPAIDDYIRFVAGQLLQGCRQRGLPLPQLQVEPGRSLVAQAGVALYRVGAIKHTAARRWVLLDGGMADNPRPALYGTRYSALPVTGLNRPFDVASWLAGPYCESGDVLIADLLMAALEPDELVAVPVSGAYHLTMGSNYNGARKPAVLWLRAGRAQLIQRREQFAELTARDSGLP